VLVAIEGEDGPGGVVEDVSVELTLTIVEAKSSSVDTDHVTETGDDGKVLKALSVENKSSELVLLSLHVDARINDLERADVALLVGLVGEGGIDDHTEDVLGLSSGDRGLSELNVLVL
jgi:hypothetical protein